MAFIYCMFHSYHNEERRFHQSLCSDNTLLMKNCLNHSHLPSTEEFTHIPIKIHGCRYCHFVKSNRYLDCGWQVHGSHCNQQCFLSSECCGVSVVTSQEVMGFPRLLEKTDTWDLPDRMNPQNAQWKYPSSLNIKWFMWTYHTGDCCPCRSLCFDSTHQKMYCLNHSHPPLKKREFINLTFISLLQATV